MQNTVLSAIILSMLCVPITHAASENAGIVDGLWYDPEPFFAGDMVRIYVAVRNNTGGDLSGTVDFYDGEVLIGKSSFSTEQGHVIESWTDWRASEGTHALRAQISKAVVASTPQGDSPLTTELAEDIIVVDRDTDTDGLGDSTDTDDDNDGISDSDERALGTDPSVADTQRQDGSAETEKKNSSHNTADEQGIEQYLAENRAHQLFSHMTDAITTSKQKLDIYRERRAEVPTPEAAEHPTDEQSKQHESTSTNSGYTSDGFGTVARSSQSSSWTTWLGHIFEYIKKGFNAGYTGILFLLSLFLGYPALVELCILIVILVSIYYTARRLSRRPF